MKKMLYPKKWDQFSQYQEDNFTCIGILSEGKIFSHIPTNLTCIGVFCSREDI